MKFDLQAWAKRHPYLASEAGLSGKERATLPSGALAPGEAAEQALYSSLSALGIAHEPQYRWHPERKWRADAAIPEHRLLVEVDGEIHRVHRDKWLRDIEKHNAYTALRWHCLRFTPEQAEDGTAANTVQAWLEGRRA